MNANERLYSGWSGSNFATLSANSICLGRVVIVFDPAGWNQLSIMSHRSAAVLKAEIGLVMGHSWTITGHVVWCEYIAQIPFFTPEFSQFPLLEPLHHEMSDVTLLGELQYFRDKLSFSFPPVKINIL